MKKIMLKAQQNEISKGFEFIRTALSEMKVEKKEIVFTLLSAEEVLAKLIANCSSEEETVKVYVKSLLGNITIHMSCKGERFELSELRSVFEYTDEDDAETEAVIRSLMNKVLGDNITISNRHNVNMADIRVSTTKYQQIIYTIFALVFGVIIGFVMKFFVPSFVTNTISQNIFSSISTMFLNALKMIVGPLVFFSIASSIADFGDLKALGRIASKVIGCYIITSAIAIMIGYSVYQIFPIGDTALVEAITDDAATTIAKGEELTLSISDTIVNIVPSDFITPFLRADMLQIIFMAAILGIGASKLSDNAVGVRKAIVSANAVFSKITAMIISFMPIAVFCSMAKMVIGMDIKNLIKVAAWVPLCYIGYIFMIFAYLILILVAGRLNPLKFIKGFMPAMLTPYTLSSSNAAMPTSIKQCDEKLGIAKKRYIPFPFLLVQRLMWMEAVLLR